MFFLSALRLLLIVAAMANAAAATFMLSMAAYNGESRPGEALVRLALAGFLTFAYLILRWAITSIEAANARIRAKYQRAKEV